MVSTPQATIKLEVSLINRGSYNEVEMRTLCERAQNEFDTFCEIAVVPKGQLYVGKICAALDRQHPSVQRNPAAAWGLGLTLSALELSMI